MSRSQSLFLVALVALAAAGGCATRKFAATQTTPAAFDPAKSDPKAIALADEVLAAVGGEANWAKAKEISWSQYIIVDGNVKDLAVHSWDRWNGRHRFTRVDQSGASGTSMYEVFSDTGTAEVRTAEGQHGPAMKEQAETMIKEARRRLALDGYMLTMVYKLKDPGVKLSYVEERPDYTAKDANAPMKYDVLKVTFDEGVGPAPGDVYYVVVDKASKLPDIIEYVPAGKTDDNRIGYRLTNWQDVGGLKFATIRDNIGYAMQPDAKKGPITVPKAMAASVPELPPLQVTTPGEQIIFNNIVIRESPTDENYVPVISTDR
jgi:hypothetical protein